MSAYSTAYSSLIIRLEEIEAVLSLARATAKAPPVRRNLVLVHALCRGGVVLLCSHIEGYIEDLGILAIDRIASKKLPKHVLSEDFRYFLSRDLIAGIKDSTHPPTVASKVRAFFTRDAHIWDNSSDYSSPLPATAFVGNFSNPRPEQIRRFFSRFGYTQFERDLAHRLTHDFRACRNMVDQVVEQRNKIAHGDSITTGTPQDLADMLRLVKSYCRVTDQVVGDWFRTKGCSIR
ncbi:MAG: hypothetical protein IIB77_14590 [Proteobacteria bacterium]|nr:hypothetical protein [Pseudomonadota bacterium]